GRDDLQGLSLSSGSPRYRHIWRTRHQRPPQPDGAGDFHERADPPDQGRAHRGNRGLWRGLSPAPRYPHRHHGAGLCRWIFPRSAVMTSKDYHYHLVRPGIAIYGGRAINGRPNPMAPVISMNVPILQIKDARIGETVGYGAAYRLRRDTRIAIMALGYADGYF